MCIRDRAFCVGGGICLLGEVLRGWYLGMGLEAQLAGTRCV